MRLPVVVLSIACLPFACARPDPATGNETLAPGDGWNSVVLDARGRDEARSIMRQATAVSDPQYPQPAPRGVRWSDVPDAASAAAVAVEMAVTRSVQLNAPNTPPDANWREAFLAKPPAAIVGDPSDGRERWIFEIKSIRDERGWLVVVRDPAAAHGQVGPVSAQIGVIGQRTAEAQSLVKAFDAALERLGTKPGFSDD